MEVGDYCSQLIDDGACLQLGIGTIPDAVLSFLGGKYSRIVPRLDEGAAVTTSRNDVHYIVTEYGIADLRGKSLGERAKQLINIAHPDFREQLARELSRMPAFQF